MAKTSESVVGLVRRAFSFLERDYGCVPGEPKVRQRELSLSFASEKVVVTVNHEFFGALDVWLTVRTDDRQSTKVVKKETFGLYLLVRDERPEDVSLLLPERLREEDGSLESCLGRHAELLARHGRDLLKGDVSRVPRLKRLRAEETRRRNKEEWGTSTGETPRFKERPSLEELFSDATNEGMKSPRAYQGFWDYDYSLTEIAAFLGIDEPDVQALLDEWDGLL